MTKTTPNAADTEPSAPSQRITPHALLELKRLSDPQIHPDGQRVAFTVHEADFEESRWVSHIWLTEYLPPAALTDPVADESLEPIDPLGDAEESAPCEPPTPDELTRQLTFSIEGETDPLWSPDGRNLAFLASRPDPTVAALESDDDEAPVSQIWSLPLEGGESRRITNTKETILDFCWAPDGATLLYVTLEPRPRPIEGAYRDRLHRKVDPTVEHDDPRRRQFWRITIEERKPHLLFTADYGVEAFALSPQGDRIVYLTNYTGEENDYHIADLYLRDLEAGATVKLVQRNGGKYRLRWSPSGEKIAFLSWQDPDLSYSQEALFTVAVPSREEMAKFTGDMVEAQKTVDSIGALGYPDIRNAHARIEAVGIAECQRFSQLDSDIISFEWLDDSVRILALAACGTSTQLYNLKPADVDPAGGTSSQPGSLTTFGPDRRDLAVHRESGCAAWIEESANRPPEIVLRDSEGREHILTQLNSSFPESYRIPRQEVVSWSAPDGRRIEGVLTYPLDYISIQPHPLIVQVHGGPKGRATNTLTDYPMPAMWSAEGYAVLRPNYRGSEGYGNDFAVANRRDLGGGDYNDVLAGVDWAIAEGIADPERIGILGGSYGGYMVNWAIGHTNRFKAAISMFGIFHLQTDYSNSRLSRWEHDYMGAYYWEDPEIYRKLSPASYLESIRTPTLILHGDEDDNTSISNSREIYRALTQRGVPTQFVHYPREGHGIQEPNHRLDEARRCLAWMDRYVRSDGGRIPMYRVGDRVPHIDGLLELCVTSADVTTFIGDHEPSDSKRATTLLEIVFTIHNLNPGQAVSPLTFEFADVHLSETPNGDAAADLVPIGVPLDLPGGKILVEGKGLHLVQRPDPETGELAFAVAVVFRAPMTGARLLHVAEFPAVAVSWHDAGDEIPTEN